MGLQFLKFRCNLLLFEELYYSMRSWIGTIGKKRTTRKNSKARAWTNLCMKSGVSNITKNVEPTFGNAVTSPPLLIVDTFGAHIFNHLSPLIFFH